MLALLKNNVWKICGRRGLSARGVARVGRVVQPLQGSRVQGGRQNEYILNKKDFLPSIYFKLLRKKRRF
jgi:hypothetical protein